MPFQAHAKPFVFPDHPEWGVTYWDWSLVPVLDRAGEVDFLVFFLKDVTRRTQVEQELRVASRYARSLIEASLDPLVTISSIGQITDVNQATELATGITRDHLIGTDFSDYFTEPDKAKEGYQRVLSEGLVRDYPLTIRHTSGRTIDVLYNATVYRDEAGQVLGVFAAARDITEHKAVEQVRRRSEARYRSLVTATAQIIWTTNSEGQVVDDIPTWRAFTGQTFDEVQGSGWATVVHPADRKRVAAVWAQAVETQSLYETEYRLRRQDGQYRHFAVRGVPVQESEEHSREWIGTCTDITERKRIEAELEHYREHLEELVQQRTQQWEAANAQLQQEIAERKRAEESLRQARDELELKVEERTGDLRHVNQILRMISDCNHALVHISEERELIQEICRIINDIGGYRMAWVGIAEHDKAKNVRPIASVGFEAGYLDKIKITWANNRFGRGPTGTAIRTDKLCAATDFLSDPKLAPWRKQAIQRGFRSSIALPLTVGGRSLGALTIYSDKPAAFDQRQITLLTDLAGDLSFGITSLRAQAERDQAQQSLKQKTAQLRALTGELALAEQRERRRIAQILHDQLQQLLVGARYGLESLRFHSKSSAFQQARQRVDNLLGKCLETSRSLVSELSPPILYEAGLAPALKWLGRWFRETHGLTVKVIADEQASTEPEEIRVALFQAVRELLFNVVKYALVKQAQVRINRLDNQQLKIVVSDHSVGFDPAQLRAKEGTVGGFGVFSLRERLELLGGQMKVESAPRRGSRFTLVAPL
jgi:PAS domain S-box-containing protein